MFKKIILITLGSLIIGGACSFAELEKSQSIRAMARVFPETINVGDEISFLVMIDAPESFIINKPVPNKGGWGSLELKSDTLLRESRDNNSKRYIFKYVLTAFDIGDFKTPVLAVGYVDAGAVNVALLNSIPIKVVPIPQGPKEKDDIKPIKGPISLSLKIWRDIFLGVVTLALLVLLGMRLQKIWRKKKMDDEALKPPHIRLELELARLQDQHLLGQDRFKEHYAELSDILRRYIERRFSIEALELTTRELLALIKEKSEISTVQREKIKEILETSDLVKFAKFAAPRNTADGFASYLLQFAQETTPVETKKK